MNTQINLKGVYAVSEDVVARCVQGEFIIIPITSEIIESEGEIFSLNNFGKAIWDKIDGKRNLKEIIDLLVSEFEGARVRIESDCLGFMKELLKRKIIKLKS
jgi:hypothetical protein